MIGVSPTIFENQPIGITNFIAHNDGPKPDRNSQETNNAGQRESDLSCGGQFVQ